VLYSRSDNSVALSVDEWVTEAVAAGEVDQRIGPFAHQPPIWIRGSAIGNLPGATATSNISGAVHDGAMYLFLDQLGSRADVQRTLFHELLHCGLRHILSLDQFVAQMLNLYERDASIKAFADEWAASEVGQRAASLHGSECALARGVDETLASLAEPNARKCLKNAPLDRV